MVDFYSYRETTGDADADREQVREIYRSMRKDGAKWMRVTLVDDQHKPCETGPHIGMWVEGWFARPKEEGPFNPPLTEAT